MSKLIITVDEWLGTGDCPAAATLGQLRIAAGGTTFTRIEDLGDPEGSVLVLPHVAQPASDLAEWLVANWWRLRWEADLPASNNDPYRLVEWLEAHSMSAIDRGAVWPPLVLASLGESIVFSLAQQKKAFAADIRYMAGPETKDIPARDFEEAVDAFVPTVLERLERTLSGYRDLHEAWDELQEERADPTLARHCRWQAQAGIDPGEAPDGWLERAEALAREIGEGNASGEVLAVLGEMPNSFASAEEAVAAIRNSATRLDLSGLPASPASTAAELPWQRGVRLARWLRGELGITGDALSDRSLGDLVGVSLPAPADHDGSRTLLGAFRDDDSGAVPALFRASRRTSQRFYLARLIGAALTAPGEDHLLPITEARTMTQKVTRAFARELLCPWEALDAFTDEKGLDDDAIDEAAEHFGVSPKAIGHALAHHGKVSGF